MYKVNKNIPQHLMGQLIQYSNNADDKDVQTTSDPKRFKDENSINEWLKKGRTIYTLENNGVLLGIFWFGKAEIPDEIKEYNMQYTFAGRLYGELRGKGLFREILRNMFKIFIDDKNYDGGGFWGESKNPAMIKSCEKIGFKQVGKNKIDTNIKSNSWENKQVFMVAKNIY
ncbi:MAG: hypothetical protein LBT02_02085 [Rickettsiales bacterium]|jgi:hypothetical protein|nr:hypothetical protein [Rickettsiales bacterium]